MNIIPLLLSIIFMIGLIIFAPLVTIWALNLLFGTHIPVTFATWFATIWIGSIVASPKISTSNK